MLDALATTVCGAGFWEWSAEHSAARPTFADFQRFAAGRWPDVTRTAFDEMVRREFEARCRGIIFCADG